MLEQKDGQAPPGRAAAVACGKVVVDVARSTVYFDSFVKRLASRATVISPIDRRSVYLYRSGCIKSISYILNTLIKNTRKQGGLMLRALLEEQGGGEEQLSREIIL